MKITTRKLLLWFYLATPAFLILDLGLNWDMRVSFLDEHAGLKILYYLFCLTIGYFIWKVPALEYILGIVEGGINILLLSLSLLLPYYEAIDNISSDIAVTTSLNTFTILNYLLTGLFLVISIQLRGLNSR